MVANQLSLQVMLNRAKAVGKLINMIYADAHADIIYENCFLHSLIPTKTQNSTTCMVIFWSVLSHIPYRKVSIYSPSIIENFNFITEKKILRFVLGQKLIV